MEDLKSSSMSASRVKSADRVLSILTFLSGRLHPTPAKMIAEACDLPRSSTYHLLHAMRTQGFVTYYPVERRWGLGLAAFEVGSAYLRSAPLERLGQPIMRSLAHEANTAVHLAVLHGTDVLYLSNERPPQVAPQLTFEVGVRVPAHLTAVGRAMLMHLSTGQFDALYPVHHPIPGPLGSNGYLRTRLERELAEAREQRACAFEDSLIVKGVSCLAAPVFSYEGYPIAAIGVTFFSDDRLEGAREGLTNSVCEAAGGLSSALSCRQLPSREDAMRPD